MKKILICFIITLLFSYSLFSQQSINYDISFFPYTITDTLYKDSLTYNKVTINDCDLLSDVGKPVLPVKYVRLLIPSGKRATKTRLKEEDIVFLDKAMKNAIPSLATRSKIGQYPRLYLRVEYKNDETVLGDFRDYIELVEKNPSIRDISECSIEIRRLLDLLKSNKDKINKIAYFIDKNLDLTLDGNKVSLEEELSSFNLELIK